jgi:signal transduction histidine kinase/DNA-binding response OmpR family regulator
VVALYSYFQTNKTAVVERLAATAELSAVLIGGPLQQGAMGAVEQELSRIAQKYSLNGIELYSSDGSILAANGVGGRPQPRSLMLGEHLSLGRPFLLIVQYSHIVLHNDRPLALLILYTTMSTNIIAALVISALLVLLCSLLAFGVGFFPGRRQEAGDGERNDEASLPNYDDEEVAELVRRKTAELESQRDQALASAKAKGEFLANMSHEIRTSMNGVIGVLSLLQNSTLEKNKRRLLDAASRSADSLLLIINDILDFSKIEAGVMDFENISFDLREIVEESIALYIDTALTKKIRLHCYLPLDIATRVLGDPTRLRQIITNLLSNAVKFTEQGEVSLRVSALNVDRDKQRLCFTIEDTGIGIDPGNLDSLFDMFTQASSDTTRKYGGTGLGLNVCKKLVEMQKGEIGATGKPGQGASFWFTMEFGIVEEAPEQHPGMDPGQKRISLFDNCETCSTIISQYLRDWPVRSHSCNHGTDVLRRLQQDKEEGYIPDIVLIDYLAIADKIDVFLEGVNDLYGDDAPRIFVLARQNSLDEQLKQQGIAGIIYKPIRFSQLCEELGGVESREERAPVDTLQGRVLLVDDERINLHVGRMVLEKIGFDVETAVNGNEAIEKTAEQRYDLVLMDVQMPVVSGIEATEIIRARERERGDDPQVILAMTANALQSTKNLCLTAGMDGFITKPIKPEMLIYHIRPLLVHGKSVSRDSEKDKGRSGIFEEEGPENHRLRIWNRKLALEYVGGDEGLLAELIGMFLQRKDILLEAVQDAMKSGNGKLISNAAHAYKGAVNHFAAERCRRLARLIEIRAGQGELDGLEADFNRLKEEADVLVKELELQAFVPDNQPKG